MKKLLIIAICVASTFTTVLANNSEVSRHVLVNFQKTFANAENVNWELNPSFAKASFINEGKLLQAYYNDEGELIASSRKISLLDLSNKAIKAIAKRYPSAEYNVKAVMEFTLANNSVLQYVSLESNSEKVVLEVTPAGTVQVFNTLIK